MSAIPDKNGDHHGNAERSLHLRLGNHAFLHTTQWPDALFGIASFHGIAIVIGEVGENLQHRRRQ